MPAAASLAAKLKTAFSVDANLIAGKGGVFDVVVDGELVYSKHDTHQFPDEDKLVKDLAEKTTR